MKTELQDKSITIRIKKELYQDLTNMAISQSVKEGKIIKISEIIRNAIQNMVNNG